MTRKIFVNLPVKDLTTSVDFFTKLGFEFNAQFTDDRAACMVVNDEAFVMLVADAYYQRFTTKDIADTATHSEAILALSAGSRSDVDELVTTALANGGHHANDPISDGPMYGWSFEDIDGHQWEVIHMDPSAIQS
jgi:predicted lactoylglutathione lyase